MTTTRVSALLGAAAALAAVCGLSGASFAADLGSIKDVPPPAPSKRAWYIKGTIGMHNHEYDGYSAPGVDMSLYTIHHEDMKSAPFYGIGIGTEHGRWLRIDVTGEYRGKFVFFGQDSYNNGLACPGPGCGTNELTADIEGWLGLTNAYINLGNWRGITPYIGGGIGFAHMSVNGFKDVNVPTGAVYYGADKSVTNFAWALYAGLSYDVTPQFSVDLGYRYVDMGDIESGKVVGYDGSVGYDKIEIADVVSHDLMVSLRYRLDTPQYYPVAIK